MSASSAAPVLELESLFVRIYADATQYLRTLDQVKVATYQLNAVVSSLSSVAARMAVNLKPMKEGFSAIARLLRAIPSSSIGQMGLISNELLSLSVNATALGKAPLKEITKLFSSLKGFTVQASGLSAAGLSPVLSAIQSFVTRLGNMPKGAIDNVAKIGRAMSGLSNVLKVKKAGDLTSTSAFMKSFLEDVTKLSPRVYADLAKLESGMNALGRATRFAKNGGARLPSVLKNVSSSSDGTTQRLNKLSDGAMGASRSFSILRIVLAGVFALAAYEYAKLDDAITRTMAHMRDWGQGSRPTLMKSVMNLSGSSTSSATDLASAQDSLVSGGFNPAAAMRALRVSEDLAVAGGMNVKEVAEKQVSILKALGVVTNDASQNIKEMTRLSDLLAGTASVTGSSVEQMLEAMGPRFTTEMERNNVSLEQGISLLGMYSLRQMKGAEASDQAGRFLMELNKAAIQHRREWARFGVNVFDNGRMREPLSILSDMDAKMKSMSPEIQRATLYWLGFQRQGVSATAALLGMSEQMRDILKLTGGVEGFSKAMADMVRRDFLSQLKIFWNNLSNIGVVIGQALAPGIAWLSSGLNALSQWFVSLNPATANFVVYIGMLTGALLLLGPVLRIVTLSMGFVAKGLLLPFRLVGSILSGFVGVLRSVYNTVSTVVSSIASVVWSIMKDVWGSFWEVFGIIKKTLTAFVSLFTTAAVTAAQSAMGLIPILINIVSMLATIAAFVMGIGVLITLVATVGIGIGQLFTMVVSGIVAAWDSVKMNLDHVGDWLERSAGAVVGMWEGAKLAVADYFKVAVDFGDKLIGFFWNFGENMIVIWRWIGRNWQPLANDIGQITRLLVEGITGNILQLGKFILATGDVAWRGFFSLVSLYMEPVFGSLREQWSNVLDDMGFAFKTFGDNLMHNFMIVLGVMGGFAGIAAQMTALGLAESNRTATVALHASLNPLYSLQQEKQDYEDIHKEFAGRRLEITAPILADAMAQMHGPMDGIGKHKWKTDFGHAESTEASPTGIGRFVVPATGIFAGMDKANGLAKALLGNMYKEIGDKWDQTKLPNPLAMFHPQTQEALEPLLKLDKPANWQNQFEGMWRKMIGMSRPEGDGEQTGQRGPGFTFKQMSMSRFMIGGPTAEALDYQQLVSLKAIDNKLGQINESIQQNKPPQAPAPVRRN